MISVDVKAGVKQEIKNHTHQGFPYWGAWGGVPPPLAKSLFTPTK